MIKRIWYNIFKSKQNINENEIDNIVINNQLVMHNTYSPKSQIGEIIEEIKKKKYVTMPIG